MPDSLSDRYAELLTGPGSEETLDNAHLMHLAGRFSRRIHG